MLSSLRRVVNPAVVAAGVATLGFGVYSGGNGASMSTSLAPMVKNEWREFAVGSVKDVNHNTKRIRIELPSGDNTPVASVVMVQTMKEDGTPVVRPYTPINASGQNNFIELAVKAYPAPGGVMSRYLTSLQPGDNVRLKGPFKKLPYSANKWKEIGMIAGGTGITPMLQVANEVLNNPEDKTKVSLIFANVTDDDILLREELKQLERVHSDRFKVYYTLDRPPSGWEGGQGYVTADMIRDNLPPASLGEDVCVMVCGPNPMLKMIAGPKDKRAQGTLEGLLKELGFTEENVFKF